MARVIRAARLEDRPRLLGVAERVPDAAISALEMEAAEIDVLNVNDETDNTASNEFSALEQRLREAEARAEQAEGKLREIEATLDEVRAEAVQDGRAAGYREGEEAVRVEFRDALDTAARVVDGLHQSRAQLLEEQEDTFVEVIFAALTKILGEAMTTPDATLAVVREVIQHTTEGGRWVVRISPADHHLLSQCRQQLSEECGGLPLELIPDSRVELGGCILEGNAGSLDGRLEVQLQRLRETLLDARACRRAEKAAQT